MKETITLTNYETGLPITMRKDVLISNLKSVIAVNGVTTLYLDDESTYQVTETADEITAIIAEE